MGGIGEPVPCVDLAAVLSVRAATVRDRTLAMEGVHVVCRQPVLAPRQQDLDNMEPIMPIRSRGDLAFAPDYRFAVPIFMGTELGGCA